MSRFYQTTERDFVDDFIFEPNMELAMMALGKKDADIQEQVDTLDLFGNLPVDYWKDVDQENVKEIKEEYENKVSDIAKTMQGNLMNTGANQRAINGLRKEIEKEYEFGRIRNIQDNAKAYKEFDAMIKAMPNPADREGYRKMVQNYMNETEGKGALDRVFKPDELYNSRDIWGEFTESAAFKNLKPDEKSSQVVNTGGKWVVKNGNSTVALSESKIGQAFKAFTDSANLQGYGNSRQKYFNENWLDEQGNVKMDDSSYLGNILANGVPSLAYSSKNQSQDKTADPYELNKQQFNLNERAAINAENRAQAKAAKEAELKNVAGAMGMSEFTPLAQSNVADQLGASKYLQDKLSEFITPFTKATFGKNDFKTQREALTQLIKDPKYQKEWGSVYKRAVEFSKELKNAKISSRETIYNLYGGDKTKTDMFFDGVASAAQRGAHLYTPTGGNYTSENQAYTWKSLQKGGAYIKGEKVKANTVEMHKDQIQFIAMQGSQAPSEGMVAIPVSYKIDVLKPDAKKNSLGKYPTSAYQEEERYDYIYSRASNYMIR